MELEKYIYPIKSSDTYGNGVLVGNYFITAAHVIEEAQKAYVTIEGKRYELTNESAFVFKTDNENRYDGYDIAIFKFDDIEPSPLVLSDIMPSENIELTSICYNHTSIGAISKSNFSLSKNVEKWVLVRDVGRIIAQYGNYIECQLNGELKEGNSGCPILYENSVVGILNGDKDNKTSSETVLFLSSQAIISLLKDLSININMP